MYFPMPTVEELEAKVKQLEADHATEKAALIAKRDQLLEEVKKLKEKYRDALGEVDPTEAIAAYNRYKKGELVPKDSLETELKGEWEKQSAKQLADLREEIKKIREEKEAEKQKAVKATLNGSFTSVLAPLLNVKPKHLLTILETEQRLKLSEAGEPVGLYKGEELTPEKFVEKLREDVDYQGYFKPSGASGSGINLSDKQKKTTNPWVTKNITQQMQMMKTNPEMAAKLKAEASAK